MSGLFGLLARLLLLLLIQSSAHAWHSIAAESFGWDAYAFEWSPFQKKVVALQQEHKERTNHFSFYYQIVSRGKITRSNKEYKDLVEQAKFLQKGSNPQRVINEKKDLFAIMLLALVVDNPAPALKVKDFSAIYFSSFKPGAMYAVFKQQKSLGNKSWFALFKAGRPWGQKEAAASCMVKPNLLIKYQYPWGYCIDAYFILSPVEAKQFSSELTTLKTTSKQWLKEAYHKDLENLSHILEEVSGNGSGLLFVGRVFDR